MKLSATSKIIFSAGATTLGVSLLLVGVFFITKDTVPTVSELAFIEHSVLGKDSGSIIPASCNSVPPTSHFLTDCPPNVNTQFGGTSSFIDVTFRVADVDNVLGKGEVTTIQWDAPGATSCTATGAWGGAKPTSGTLSISNANAGLGQVDLIYTLSCTNGTKTVSRSVNIFVDGGKCINHICP